MLYNLGLDKYSEVAYPVAGTTINAWATVMKKYGCCLQGVYALLNEADVCKIFVTC